MVNIQENTEEIYDFFLKVIEGISSVSIEYENRLTGKEAMFLAKCCVFNYEGGDLKDSGELWAYIEKQNMFRRRNDMCVYKNKLLAKNWIRNDLEYFIKLPPALDQKRSSGNKLKSKIEIVFNDRGYKKEDRRKPAKVVLNEE